MWPGEKRESTRKQYVGYGLQRLVPPPTPKPATPPRETRCTGGGGGRCGEGGGGDGGGGGGFGSGGSGEGEGGGGGSGGGSSGSGDGGGGGLYSTHLLMRIESRGSRDGLNMILTMNDSVACEGCPLRNPCSK